jgi:hypothetical protein
MPSLGFTAFSEVPKKALNAQEPQDGAKREAKN